MQPTILCLDLEGVLVPEIWIEFSKRSGIPELARTTRDEPDYDKLMRFRIGLLAQHGLKLADIQDVIGGMSPLDGARAFLDGLREAFERAETSAQAAAAATWVAPDARFFAPFRLKAAPQRAALAGTAPTQAAYSRIIFHRLYAISKGTPKGRPA